MATTRWARARAMAWLVTLAGLPVAHARAQAAESGPLFGHSGAFLGAMAGVSVPTGAFRQIGYDANAHFALPVGWRPARLPFGVQARPAFDRVQKHDSTVTRATSIYSLSLEAIVVHDLRRADVEGFGVALFATGGVGAYRFRGVGGPGPLADALGEQAGLASTTRPGFSVGGGVAWVVGPATLLVESRWVNALATGVGSRAGSGGLRWMPVALGGTLR